MSAETEIRRRIQERGPITFAEFMDVALFWPQGGYYLGPADIVGPSGDYYTSPLAHPAFGALLAVQLFQMWRLLGQPAPFTVVELGAGNGLLCRDIMTYCAHLPLEFRRSLRYLCLDRRAAAGVEKGLGAEPGAPVVDRVAAVVPPVRHYEGADFPLGPDQSPHPSITRQGAEEISPVASGPSGGLPLRGIRGCFLSNELLDAFPVHQVTVRQGRLQEVYVTLRGGELAETLGEPSTPALAARLEGLGVALAEGQTAEINLGLEQWAEEVAAALDAGFVLTIDYGQPARELYAAERRFRGTLTTYYRHIQTDSPLRRIGRQDITAQVDFTSVANAGRRAGLELLGLTAQRQFLSNLGLGQFQRRLPSMGLAPRQVQADRAGIVDLARPGGLGDFKVLAQGKNVGQPGLWGFEGTPEAAELSERLPVPLLTEEHLSLLEGRYPQAEYEFELAELWPSGEHGTV